MSTIRCPECLEERVVPRGTAWAQRTGKILGRCRRCADIIRYDQPREARFWALVAKADGCWEWNGRKSPDGYGEFKVARNRDGRAHRFAYELLVGPIPEGLEIDHLCRNRGCVNPAHLEPVTPHENYRRGESFAAVNARKTHCPRGHEYTPENTYRLPSGSRWCRTCKRKEGREYMRKKRAAFVTTEEHKARHDHDFQMPKGAAA